MSRFDRRGGLISTTAARCLPQGFTPFGELASEDGLKIFEDKVPEPSLARGHPTASRPRPDVLCVSRSRGGDGEGKGGWE
jgi:hypothetical protein